MSEFTRVQTRAVRFCPGCADVYGVVEGMGKICGCDRSRAVEPRGGGDFTNPFEICWYCQAELIPSASRWNSLVCDACRPDVFALNDRLEAAGRVSLPIGRHSLQHANWPHARPFTAVPFVERRRTRRLRAGHLAYLQEDPTDGDEWNGFADFLRRRREREGAGRLDPLAAEVQRSGPDYVVQALAEANARLAAARRGSA